jgi:hypothetical protein
VTRIPWYEFALLIRPRRIAANLDRARQAGVVGAVPNTWQLCLGVLRMWHRVLFRTETVGTCHAHPVRRTLRARLLENRAVRLPFLLAEGAVAPLDFTGLASSPDRLIRHLLGAHHDGQQFVFDLQILSSHRGRLEELLDKAREVAASDSRRARWLKDLTVYENYHQNLVQAVERAVAAGVDLSDVDRDDPDITFSAYMQWCARQPASPGETARAWVAGKYSIQEGLS